MMRDRATRSEEKEMGMERNARKKRERSGMERERGEKERERGEMERGRSEI